MKILTRHNALEALYEQKGKELSSFADRHGVTIVGDSGKINKGWKGLVCEGIAGLGLNTSKAPNGLGFELKSVPYYEKNGFWVPKETMAITMLNQEDLIAHSFFQSCLWEKIKSMIFCITSWNGRNSTTSTLLGVRSFDLMKNDICIKGAEEDYEFIREKLRTKGYKALTSKDGYWIQARTKGAGHGSTSRAFYAKKTFLAALLPPIPIKKLMCG
jgi:DNA mismatch repair protein MutH